MNYSIFFRPLKGLSNMDSPYYFLLFLQTLFPIISLNTSSNLISQTSLSSKTYAHLHLYAFDPTISPTCNSLPPTFPNITCLRILILKRNYLSSTEYYLVFSWSMIFHGKYHKPLHSIKYSLNWFLTGHLWHTFWQILVIQKWTRCHPCQMEEWKKGTTGRRKSMSKHMGPWVWLRQKTTSDKDSRWSGSNGRWTFSHLLSTCSSCCYNSNIDICH